MYAHCACGSELATEIALYSWVKATLLFLQCIVLTQNSHLTVVTCLILKGTVANNRQWLWSSDTTSLQNLIWGIRIAVGNRTQVDRSQVIL